MVVIVSLLATIVAAILLLVYRAVMGYECDIISAAVGV